MDAVEPGLYEALVTEALRARIDRVGDPDRIRCRDVVAAEAPDRLALAIARGVERALFDVPERKRVSVGVDVARALMRTLGEFARVDPGDLLVQPATVLHCVLAGHPDGTPRALAEPLIPLLDTTLLTNAPASPTLWSQLRSEIDSADAIDVVMAFIRRSGIRPCSTPCDAHCDAGRPLRVLTTTYTGLDRAPGPGPAGRISAPRSASPTT